jgi:hypothetical protein
MIKIYEVLVYPVDQTEELHSIPYWFGKTPKVIKEYRTKQSAIRYAKTYAQQHRQATEVYMEWQDGADIETFQQVFYP